MNTDQKDESRAPSPQDGKGPLRLLIVSENVSMRMGGESSLPFYYAKLFTERGVEVWIACHERVRAELTTSLPHLASRTIYVRDSLLQKALFRISRILPFRIRDMVAGHMIHFSTQRRIRREALRLAQSRLIDAVLEPSPITPKGLSFMYKLGVPVVIGPMCGGMNFPPAFRRLDSAPTRVIYQLGRAVASVMNRLFPGKLQADLLLVANTLTRDALPPGARGRIVQIYESGVDLGIWKPSQQQNNARDTVRFAFSGRFVDWKGIQYLIPAFRKAAAQDQRLCLDLVGSGGEFEHEVLALARDPAIAHRIRHHGWVTRERAAEILRDADVFVMPSLRECGGGAILEALALGKPVITTNWGGPADYVDETCGILVDPSDRDSFIDGLAAAMLKLARSPELRDKLGRGGVDRVKRDHLAWDAKADRVLELIHETVDIASARKHG